MKKEKTSFDLSVYESQANQFLSKHLNTVDFHCHGIGRFDFTELSSIVLKEINDILSERKQRCILTLYLPKPNFSDFFNFMDSYYLGRKRGDYFYIEGIGLEGPLLGSHGGTPKEGVWIPTKLEWEKLAMYGRKGLQYIIFSPDAALEGCFLKNSHHPQNTAWIAGILISHGVLPAPGHFSKKDPIRSAADLQSIFDVVNEQGLMTVTDHFLNDMPHKFKHAWRKPEEKLNREKELEGLKLESWSVENVLEKMGEVPATIINNAHQGKVKVCQNFDGEHVDLEIVKKVVELLGAENLLMMTDSIESKRLAGRNLHFEPGSNLLYQSEGIVAAGSQNVYQQITNMFKIGLTEDEIKTITCDNPRKILKQNRHLYDKEETVCI